MNGRFVWGVLIVLLLLAGTIGASIYAYNAGVAQGMIDSGKLAAPAAGVVPAPVYGPFFYRPFGWGLLSCLIPLFVFFVFFSVMRMVFWRASWAGMHHRHWEGGVPPKVEEWHRKMHERQAQAGSKDA